MKGKIHLAGSQLVIELEVDSNVAQHDVQFDAVAVDGQELRLQVAGRLLTIDLRGINTEHDLREEDLLPRKPSRPSTVLKDPEIYNIVDFAMHGQRFSRPIPMGLVNYLQRNHSAQITNKR